MSDLDQIPVMFPEGIRYVNATLNGASMQRQPAAMAGWSFRTGDNDQWEAVEDNG